MHEDYQLAYCPIAYITALVFADDAFESARLTPELLHKLRVPPPGCMSYLCDSKRACGTRPSAEALSRLYLAYTYPTRPMLYHTANDALKRLGELAGYRYPIPLILA
jgi:hypothetical protein